MKFISIFLIIYSSIYLCAEDRYDADKLINKVLFKTIDEIEKKHGLKVGSFGGGPLYGVQNLSLGFSTNKKLSIEEARILLVACAEEFLKNINSDPKLRP